MIDRPIQKKEIAEAINTSPSYVTQLFNGDKLINLMTLAKLQKAFDFTFQIEARKNNDNLKEKAEKAVKLVKLKPKIDLYREMNKKAFFDLPVNEQNDADTKAIWNLYYLL